MLRTDTDVDQFLSDLDDPRADDLRRLDALIATELTGLDRALWTGAMWGGTHQEIIGYGAIRQPRPRGGDVHWFLVGLAAQQRHLSLYVNAADDSGYLVKTLGATLGRVTIGSAAVTFTSIDALDLDALRTLLRRARELWPGVA